MNNTYNIQAGAVIINENQDVAAAMELLTEYEAEIARLKAQLERKEKALNNARVLTKQAEGDYQKYFRLYHMSNGLLTEEQRIEFYALTGIDYIG